MSRVVLLFKIFECFYLFYISPLKITFQPLNFVRKPFLIYVFFCLQMIFDLNPGLLLRSVAASNCLHFIVEDQMNQTNTTVVFQKKRDVVYIKKGKKFLLLHHFR